MSASACFDPDGRLCAALIAATERDVTVEILVPGRHADERFAQLAGEEANVVVFDADLVAVLDRHLDDDRTSTREIEPTEWAERGLLQRAGEALAGIVSGEL